MHWGWTATNDIIVSSKEKVVDERDACGDVNGDVNEDESSDDDNEDLEEDDGDQDNKRKLPEALAERSSEKDSLGDLLEKSSRRLLYLFSERHHLIREGGDGSEFTDLQICAALKQQNATRFLKLESGKPSCRLSITRYANFPEEGLCLCYVPAPLRLGQQLINSTIARLLGEDEEALSYDLCTTLHNIISADRDQYDDVSDSRDPLMPLDASIFFALTSTAVLLIAQDMNVDLLRQSERAKSGPVIPAERKKVQSITVKKPGCTTEIPNLPPPHMKGQKSNRRKTPDLADFSEVYYIKIKEEKDKNSKTAKKKEKKVTLDDFVEPEPEPPKKKSKKEFSPPKLKVAKKNPVKSDYQQAKARTAHK
ncbi:hypothetical protein C8R45DRAFT_927072 [Mycena sanguinolenta]|nr:hypothetical protein C8R45DRAFT_927072 [Mycena sanguinolenta]